MAKNCPKIAFWADFPILGLIFSYFLGESQNQYSSYFFPISGQRSENSILAGGQVATHDPSLPSHDPSLPPLLPSQPPCLPASAAPYLLLHPRSGVPKISFLSPESVGSGGDLRREGVVEKFVPFLQSLSSLGFEARNLGRPKNCQDIPSPEDVQKVGAKKNVCAHFSAPYQRAPNPPEFAQSRSNGVVPVWLGLPRCEATHFKWACLICVISPHSNGAVQIRGVFGDQYDWTGGPYDGNEWKKYRVVPHVHPSRPLVYAYFTCSGRKGAFSLPGAMWDHFRCTVEPLPGHVRCQYLELAGPIQGRETQPPKNHPPNKPN